MRKSVIDSIIAEHYKTVLKYCSKHLHGDIHAAEACTQEVFLLLYQKVNSLDMTKDIRPWLYRTADSATLFLNCPIPIIGVIKRTLSFLSEPQSTNQRSHTRKHDSDHTTFSCFGRS